MVSMDTLKQALDDRGLTISTAESCTGGMLARQLTSVPGASGYFLLGCVTYSEEMKRSILHVREDTLHEHSAVSGEVACEMAAGVRELSGSDVGVSTTGYAGPEGGTGTNPVGTVYVGISTTYELISEVFHFNGDRNRVIESACEAALRIIYDSIEFP